MGKLLVNWVWVSREVEIRALLLDVPSAVLEFLHLALTKSDLSLKLCDFGHQVVPNGVLDLAAWVCFLTFNGSIIAVLEVGFRVGNSSIKRALESLHKGLPFGSNLFLHEFVVFFTAFGTLVASGEKSSLFFLNGGHGGVVN